MNSRGLVNEIYYKAATTTFFMLQGSFYVYKLILKWRKVNIHYCSLQERIKRLIMNSTFPK